jgi:UDP-3-O-acyl-N-acetylglucosamine deacetylase
MHSFSRKTLAKTATFEGRGLHSGEPVKLTVHPAEEGIVFQKGSSKWDAKPENVTDTSRCTRLGEVSTIEHLMAAFAGLGVTDAVVEVQGGELPALDGCAVAYCEGIANTGLAKFGSAQVTGPFSRVFHIDGEVEIAISSGDGRWRYEFECGDRWPNWQHFEFSFENSFAKEVAPARTFAFEEEMDAIRKAGLGKGLDEESAFLIGANGYVNKTRFDDEPARHKLLDLIGDLYLAGVPPQLLNVVGQRSGHRTNIDAAKKLKDHVTIA